MTTPAWSQNDYRQACRHLEETTEGAAFAVDCGSGVHAVLPRGLPALGVRLHGWLMLAPLPLLMASVLALPILGFRGGWGLSPVTVAVTLGCLMILGGFGWVLRLMLANRDIFPRRYFATLGPQGIAMHFSRVHFPHRSPRAAVAWKDVREVRETSGFFLPGLLLARPRVPLLEIRDSRGGSAVIPFLLPARVRARELEALHELIRRHGGG